MQSFLPILYSDADCLVINKPAGLAVHEAPWIRREQTVIGQLEKLRTKNKKLKINTKTSSLDTIHQPLYTVFLVHRLDQETSGCLLVAKNERAKEYFEKLFKDGKMDKEYVALVKGIPLPRRGTINRPLEGRRGEKVSAVTIYQTVKQHHAIVLDGKITASPLSFLGHQRSSTKRFAHPTNPPYRGGGAGVTLLNVRILTGRMHQIRKHFTAIGHPVVMDGLYGDFTFNKTFRKALGLKRLFLHACSLAFRAPSGTNISVTAPLPHDLQTTLDQLKPGRYPGA